MRWQTFAAHRQQNLTGFIGKLHRVIAKVGQNLPEAQRIAIEDAIVHVQGWLHALLKEPTPLVAFRALKMPVLLMQGSETTDSARAVAALLARTLPQVTALGLAGSNDNLLAVVQGDEQITALWRVGHGGGDGNQLTFYYLRRCT